MRYPDAASFRQALEQRLKKRSAGDGARLARDRKRVAFDRFLARLTAVAPDGWMLKGGFAIDLRLGDRARATKDVDLDWRVDDDDLLDALLDAADHDAGDYFVFRVERSAAPADRLGGSRRFRRPRPIRATRTSCGTYCSTPSGATATTRSSWLRSSWMCSPPAATAARCSGRS